MRKERNGSTGAFVWRSDWGRLPRFEGIGSLDRKFVLLVGSIMGQDVFYALTVTHAMRNIRKRGRTKRRWRFILMVTAPHVFIISGREHVTVEDNSWRYTQYLWEMA